MKELISKADSLAAGERFTLANILLGKEDYANAIPLYDALNRDYPNWSCPWRHKGEAYFNQKNYEAAVTSLQQAIATNTEHYDAYVWMAFSLNELGRYQEALTNLETAMTLSPTEEESEDEVLSPEQIQTLYKELQTKVH
jgi:tetratricopeptide (TPR) repeat protein